MAKKAETGSSNQPTPNKTELVKAALAAGKEMPDEGIAFIKTTFGVDFPKPLFSTYKSLIRARARKAGGELSSGGRSRMNGAGPDLFEAVQSIKRLVDRFGARQVHSMVELFE